MEDYQPIEINPSTILMWNSNSDRKEVDSDGRKRFVRFRWPRNPGDRYLERDQAPHGFRTPNGHVWAHSLDELGYIDRIPGVAVVSVYSRSQIKELGENYHDDEFDEPLVSPRRLRPWPVLKLPKKHPENTVPPIGAIDGGCREEHDEDTTYTIRWDEFSDDKRKSTPGKGNTGIQVRCSAGVSETCKGRLLPNDGAERVVSRDGKPYEYIWCDHFVERLKKSKDPYTLISWTIHNIDQSRIAADAVGLWLYSEMGGFRQYLPSQSSFRGDPLSLANLVVSEDSIPGRPVVPLDLVLPDVPLPSDVVAKDKDGDVHMKDQEANMAAEPRKKTHHKKVQEAKEGPFAPGLYSVKDIPKLEEFIPESLLPDILLVHDPKGVTNHNKASGGEPIKYKRIYPHLQRDVDCGGSSPDEGTSAAAKTPELVAQLHLHPTNRLGSGHHSYVYRAPLTLPEPLSARSPTGQCTVAAKLAYSRCTAHQLLRNEAEIYNQFPKDAQDHYCGYNIIPPCRFPVPVGAVVPKFYGFYVPVLDSEEDRKRMGEEWGRHRRCDEDYRCTVDWASPILLMEECGEPVKPSKFTADQRTECFSLLLRLHHHEIMQGSFYVRNVMIQPGPLTAPPSRRSFDTPSFRIIDFGRGRKFRSGVDKVSSFQAYFRDELKQAREELLLEHPVGF